MTYNLPVRPYSPIDALNRRAAALGSVGYAMAAAHADYNGHHITLSWNDFRGYYIAEYFWGGRYVLARGSFDECLRATLAEYDRGALGSSATIAPRDADAIAACEAAPQLLAGSATFKPDWYSWRHECAAASARDMANPRGMVMLFDWSLMQAAATREEYETALRTKHGRVYA